MMRNKQLNKVKGAKTRYKMYKSGKLWLFAGMTAVTLGALGFNNTNVHADATNNDSDGDNHSFNSNANNNSSEATPQTTKAIDVTANSSVASNANVSSKVVAQSATSSSNIQVSSLATTSDVATESSFVTSSNTTQASDTSQQRSTVTVASGISLRDLGDSSSNSSSLDSATISSLNNNSFDIIERYNNSAMDYFNSMGSTMSAYLTSYVPVLSEFSSTINSRAVQYTQTSLYYNSLISSANYLYSFATLPDGPSNNAGSSFTSDEMMHREDIGSYWLNLVYQSAASEYPDSYVGSASVVSMVASMYANGELNPISVIGEDYKIDVLPWQRSFDSDLNSALGSSSPTISNVTSFYDSEYDSFQSMNSLNVAQGFSPLSYTNNVLLNLADYAENITTEFSAFGNLTYAFSQASPIQEYASLTNDYPSLSALYKFYNSQYSSLKSIPSSASLTPESLYSLSIINDDGNKDTQSIWNYMSDLDIITSNEATRPIEYYYNNESAFSSLLNSYQNFLGSTFNNVTGKNVSSSNNNAVHPLDANPDILSYKVYSNVSSAGIPLTSSQTAFMNGIASMSSVYSSMSTNLDQNNNFSGSNVIAQQANSLANLVSSATSSVSLLSNALTTTLNSLKSNSNYATLIKDLISQYHVKDFAGLTSAINSQYYSNLNNLTSKFASAPNDVNDSLTPFYQNYTNNGNLLNDANNDTSNFGSDAINFTLNQGSFDTLLNQFVSNAPTSFMNLQSSYNTAYNNASQFNNDLNNAISNADVLNSLHGDINSLSSALSIANSNYNKESSAYNSLSSSESTIISSQANNLKSLESNINSLTSAKNSVVSDYQKQSSEYNSLIATNKSLSDDVKNDQQLNDSLTADLKSVTALKDTESTNYNNLSVAYDNLKKSNTATITSLTQALSNEDNTNSQESSLANSLQTKLSQAVNDQSVANKNFASETAAYKSLNSSATATINSLENELKSADVISTSLSNAAKSQSDVINNDNKSLASLNSKNANNSSQNDSLNNVIKSQSNVINSDNNSLASLSNKANDFNSLAQHLHDDDSVIASLLSHNAKLLSNSNDVKSSSSNSSSSSSNAGSSSANNIDFAGGFSDSTTTSSSNTTESAKSASSSDISDESTITLNTAKYLGLNNKATKIVEPKSQYQIEKSLFELSSINKSDYVGKTIKLTKFAYLHSKFDFKHDNHKRLIRPGKTFKIKDIVVKNGITRLLINKHQYLTGNTKFVKLLNHK